MGGPGSGPQKGGGRSGKSLNPLRRDKGFMKLASAEKARDRARVKAAEKAAAKKKALNATFKSYGRGLKAAGYTSSSTMKRR